MSTTLDKLPAGTVATLIEVIAHASDVEHFGIDLGRRLMELGFIAGEKVRVLRRAFPFGDPIAVKVGNTTLALRGFEAALVRVQPD
jgi:ferrous iron transport protein A